MSTSAETLAPKEGLGSKITRFVMGTLRFIFKALLVIGTLVGSSLALS